MNIHLHKNDLPAEITFGGSVAIDTETMGLKPHRDRLCVVQLSGGDGVCHLVQITPGTFQAPNLSKLLADPTIIKIFHYARFDIATLYHHLGVMTNNIYCTKIAAKFVRTFTDRHGLKDLCRELLGVELSKQEQTSDWGADILTPEQKKYAATDVLYLHQLKERLDILLAREKKQDLAAACFHFLPTRAKIDLLCGEEYDIFHH